MQWHQDIQTHLNDNNYQRVVQFYEQLIETNSLVIEDYFYLGLAYLLQDREEDAQATWLLVLSQAAESELSGWIETLTQILDAEATRQENSQRLETSYLIRLQLQNLNPSFLNNLLHLMELEIQFQIFAMEKFNDWCVFELLENTATPAINLDLLLRVTEKVLIYPCTDTIHFLELAALHINNPEIIAAKVISAIVNYAYQQKQSVFAINLVELCLRFLPEDLYLQNSLFNLYKTTTVDYKKSLEIADNFYKSCQTTTEKLLGISLVIGILQAKGDWGNLPKFIDELIQLIERQINAKQFNAPPFIIDSILGVTSCLPYYQDNPKINRYLQSKLAEIFQADVRTRYKYIAPVSSPKSPARKIKIGYIAHTLRRHSVGWLSRWLFHYHNRDKFEIYTYFVNQAADEITQKWFKNNSDYSYNLPAKIEQITAQIRQDNLDILVDIDSLTNNTTYLVMALKPAPIQVTWLGLDASGIPAIDYFIADNYVLPKNAEEIYSEKIIRLPNSYLSVDGFEVGVPTRRRTDLNIPDDAIIYLTVQSGLKRTLNMIYLQLQILQQVPNSYLLIKGFADKETIRELFLKSADELGISQDRLRFLPNDFNEETHRANLGIADIVLDTYPYNGATTTLETLWMGIPLVTRVGEQFAARNSYTFMKNAGISQGIAWNDEEYVQWGIKLGLDENLREEIRYQLRQSRHISTLWNAKKFTIDMEKAYEQIWQNHHDD
ncbi:MAG: O-linked N-acetylglucosamine transferase, SPINDLY family protein [Microcystis sp.]|uniref:O-linked N-acetylglucosamine transferase, SPINDLY family protein n=1 Tax=Microcystis sp. TaxID=1127 RepID=UPI00391A29C0